MQGHRTDIDVHPLHKLAIDFVIDTVLSGRDNALELRRESVLDKSYLSKALAPYRTEPVLLLSLIHI